MAGDDLFDDLFNLEENFHKEGYDAGHADGLEQARLEAHVFGIEQGYQKFIEMGKLQAKAKVWSSIVSQEHREHGHEPTSVPSRTAPAAAGRLEKHLSVLQALVDPATLSFDNTDDAVADFDDRLKRAQAKVKIMERLLGEDTAKTTRADKRDTASAAMEDFGS